MNGIRSEKTGTYTVLFVTYSGMTIPLEKECSREEAQLIVRAMIREARARGQTVSKVDWNEWEFEDDGQAISDQDGYLIVRPQYRRYRVILGRRSYLN